MPDAISVYRRVYPDPQGRNVIMMGSGDPQFRMCSQAMPGLFDCVIRVTW